MRRELHHIPPAPRTPRWPPVLWARWPLAFVAFLGAVYGGVITLMFYYAWGGKPGDDDRLDEHGRRTLGTVVAVEPVPGRAERSDLAKVSYRFVATPGSEIEANQYRPGADYVPGKSVDVEYLADSPHTTRLYGTRLSSLPNLAVPLWRWFVLPGLASLMLWLLGVLRTRSLMRHGDVAVAELIGVHPVPLVLPSMLRVSYRFLDRHAQERRSRHWVRRRSRLGAKLTATPAPQSAPVVHDRAHPWQSRVVTVDDFVLAPTSPHLHADAATPWTHDP
jgi:hypothetical protein